MATTTNNHGRSVTIAVRTSPETKEQLEALAEDMGRSTSNLAHEAIATYIKENAWQVEAIGRAVAKADAGGPFVPLEDVKRWVESWGTDHQLPPPEATIRR
jgi:RHH-type transcriptional regulator, rel operon repressor / antitoxin RelB